MDLIPILEKSFLEIANLMKNQNTLDLGDYMDEYNFSGDDVKQLDLMSNVILKTHLEKCGQIRCIGSEEDEELHYTKYTRDNFYTQEEEEKQDGEGEGLFFSFFIQFFQDISNLFEHNNEKSTDSHQNLYYALIGISISMLCVQLCPEEHNI